MPGKLLEPVLALQLQTLQSLPCVSEDEIFSIWALFTKCKDNLENGRRLENISWRLWYRSHSGMPCGSTDTKQIHSLDLASSSSSLTSPASSCSKTLISSAPLSNSPGSKKLPQTITTTTPQSKPTSKKPKSPISFQKLISSLEPEDLRKLSSNKRKAMNQSLVRSDEGNVCEDSNKKGKLEVVSSSTETPQNSRVSLNEDVASVGVSRSSQLDVSSSNNSDREVTPKASSATLTPTKEVLTSSKTSPQKVVFFIPGSSSAMGNSMSSCDSSSPASEPTLVNVENNPPRPKDDTKPIVKLPSRPSTTSLPPLLQQHQQQSQQSQQSQQQQQSQQSQPLPPELQLQAQLILQQQHQRLQQIHEHQQRIASHENLQQLATGEVAPTIPNPATINPVTTSNPTLFAPQATRPHNNTNEYDSYFSDTEDEFASDSEDYDDREFTGTETDQSRHYQPGHNPYTNRYEPQFQKVDCSKTRLTTNPSLLSLRLKCCVDRETMNAWNGECDHGVFERHYHQYETQHRNHDNVNSQQNHLLRRSQSSLHALTEVNGKTSRGMALAQYERMGREDTMARRDNGVGVGVANSTVGTGFVEDDVYDYCGW